MIMCKAQHAKAIDKAIFPGLQGGPLMHIIAAKGVAFFEALRPEYLEYNKSIVANAQALAQALSNHGYKIVSGGTDNHLLMVKLVRHNITGRECADHLDKANITVNKNTIPFETESPFVTSGIRLGTPAVTTRGFGIRQMQEIAGMIHDIIAHKDVAIDRVRAQAADMCKAFPLYI
jgi:glycine hydroxymethyltransferase